MKILLLGKNGQVGWELNRTLLPLGEVVALGREELDLTKEKAIRKTMREIKPHLVINAAAYTAVDKAEEEPYIAMAVNGTAPGILAEEAKRINAVLLHYSTDYVFDGKKNEPYTENDSPNPINVYGKTKLAGERNIQVVGVPHLIFRTSWVYGLRGSNFLRTILNLAKSKKELRIVDDQIGNPTWSRLVAEITAQTLGIIRNNNDLEKCTGIYHLTASGETSWFGFAKASLKLVAERQGLKIKPENILPITTAEFPTLAERPVFSVMSNSKLQKSFNINIPNWELLVKLALT